MPEAELMAIENGVDLDDGTPFVAIHLDDLVAHLPPSRAREFAMLMLEAAETALTACAIRELLKEHNEQRYTEEKATEILDEIKERRDRLAQEG
jgi:hypothetical protein